MWGPLIAYVVMYSVWCALDAKARRPVQWGWNLIWAAGAPFGWRIGELLAKGVLP